MTPPPEASHMNNTAKLTESRKNGLDPGDNRGGEREKKNSEKSSVADGSDDEGRPARDRRKEERNGDERRPKREREDTPEKTRPRERRFREVKERESPKERDFPRERSWRTSSDRGRWDGEERSKSYREQEREKGSMRGGYRGGRRSFSGATRQGGAFGSNQGRYNSGDRESRQGNWGGDRYHGGSRDSSYRKQPSSYRSKGEKWKHDMFETVVDGGRNEPEEDPIAKIEALLAS
ncbi:hypothetical protein R1flu_011517 [Riccia fluitans]|uniref:Btz domain-containing protein n=1 Tax=Riccia fluitans TaxID=41844 RepID=A0ABD1Z889_9MARC